MSELQQIIEQAWETRTELQPGTAPARVGEAAVDALGQSRHRLGLDAQHGQVVERHCVEQRRAELPTV